MYAPQSRSVKTEITAQQVRARQTRVDPELHNMVSSILNFFSSLCLRAIEYTSKAVEGPSRVLTFVDATEEERQDPQHKYKCPCKGCWRDSFAATSNNCILTSPEPIANRSKEASEASVRLSHKSSPNSTSLTTSTVSYANKYFEQEKIHRPEKSSTTVFRVIISKHCRCLLSYLKKDLTYLSTPRRAS